MSHDRGFVLVCVLGRITSRPLYDIRLYDLIITDFISLACFRITYTCFAQEQQQGRLCIFVPNLIVLRCLPRRSCGITSLFLRVVGWQKENLSHPYSAYNSQVNSVVDVHLRIFFDCLIKASEGDPSM